MTNDRMADKTAARITHALFSRQAPGRAEVEAALIAYGEQERREGIADALAAYKANAHDYCGHVESAIRALASETKEKT